jgi:hypothetical protein
MGRRFKINSGVPHGAIKFLARLGGVIAGIIFTVGFNHSFIKPFRLSEIWGGDLAAAILLVVTFIACGLGLFLAWAWTDDHEPKSDL